MEAEGNALRREEATKNELSVSFSNNLIRILIPFGDTHCIFLCTTLDPIERISRLGSRFSVKTLKGYYLSFLVKEGKVLVSQVPRGKVKLPPLTPETFEVSRKPLVSFLSTVSVN